MMNTGLQTEGTFQWLLINIVEIKYFERFTKIVGLFGSLKQFDYSFHYFLKKRSMLTYA